MHECIRIAATAEIPLLRQRDKLRLAGYPREAAGFPIGLGLFDALLARGDEVPPDMARAVRRGAAEDNDARVAQRRDGDAVARLEDKQSPFGETVAGNLDLARHDIDRAL